MADLRLVTHPNLAVWGIPQRYITTGRGGTARYAVAASSKHENREARMKITQ